MNSQKVQRVTKLHARDLLPLSLQLLQPKREAAEGTTENSEKPTNNQTEDTRMGTIYGRHICIMQLYKFMKYLKRIDSSSIKAGCSADFRDSIN